MAIGARMFGIRDFKSDWAKLVYAAERSPELLLKSLPPAMRTSMVPFTRKVKQLARSEWPEQIFYRRDAEPVYPRRVKTKVPQKKWHTMGTFRMRFRPAFVGAATLLEFGSYKQPFRYPRTSKFLAFKNEEGKWIYPKKVRSTKPKPVWRKAYKVFKAQGGPRNIQETILKQAQFTMFKALTKTGMAPTIFTL